MPSSTEQVADRAIDLALSLLESSTPGQRTYKTDRDFATATDFAIEDAVRDLLAHETPDIGFLGEERGHLGDQTRYWCLDPIDGTTNFSRGLPNYGVSLALIESGRPAYGAIALPRHGERYVTRSNTAYLNGASIRVAPTSELHDAIISTGDFATGAGSQAKNARRIAMIAQMADAVGRIRMLGSAATDLAWLAAGRLDAVVIDANHPWDVAAGVALAGAAGATVSQVDGTAYSVTGQSLLAATPRVHAALASILDPVSKQ